MKSIILHIILMISGLLLSNSRIAFIAEVSGYVEIVSGESNQHAVEAVKGRYLYEGDIVRSFKDSHCIVMFEDQASIFALGSYSEAKLRKIDEGIKKINFNYGKLYIENSSKEIPLFIFTRASQILSLESSGFITSLTNGNDEVYCIENKIDLYNKKSKLEIGIYDKNKVLSLLDGSLELKENEEGFMPKELESSIRIIQKNIKAPLQEIVYQRGDLIPNYSVNTYLDTYSPKPKKKYHFFLGGGLSYINSNAYAKITLNGIYNNSNINLAIELDQYFPIESSPDIKVWDTPIKILSKIKRLNFSSKSKHIVLKSGELKGITFGHGLLLNNYSNRYNYPLKNNYGLSFKYNDRDFLSFELFVSNIDHFSNSGALIGMHSSVFISKYIPLKIGIGLVSDLNQFINIKDQYNFSIEERSINSLEFDVSYDMFSKRGFELRIVGEVAAIIFPDSHYYKRYDSDDAQDLGSGLKDKGGTWGALMGINGNFQNFIKFNTHFHYNDPLFVPAFFNNTYEFERNRLLPEYSSSIPQINDMFEGFSIENENGVSGLIVPKDLYFAHMEDEMVFPSIGFSVGGVYNYYNKAIANFQFSSFFEYDSQSKTDSYSSIYLDLLIKNKIIKNIAELKLYINKNYAHNVFDFLSNNNENTIVGASFHTKLKNNFNLIFYFERVHYDYDFDFKSERVGNIEIEAVYSF